MNGWNIPGVTPLAHEGNLPLYRVENEFASAVLSPYGAHVLSYTPSGEKDLLFVSAKSAFSKGQPIRGGIPVCWPYFGPAADGGPAHGYARIAEWELIEAKRGPAGHEFRFKLPENALPEKFAGLTAAAEVRIGAALELTLTTENRSGEIFELSDALHTYFAVGDCREVSLAGLAGKRYFDALERVEKQQQGDVTIDHEVNHIYLDAEDACLLSDPVWKHRIRIVKTGSKSTVVWNPWIAKSREMEDFGDGEYLGMLCVESANANIDKRMLKPGEFHRIGTMLSIEPL